MGWNPSELKDLRKGLGLSQRDFARAVGADVRTVLRWESGQAKPSGASEAVLSGIREKIRQDPGTTTTIAKILASSIVFGGLSYLILRLFEELSEQEL